MPGPKAGEGEGGKEKGGDLGRALGLGGVWGMWGEGPGEVLDSRGKLLGGSCAVPLASFRPARRKARSD